jgi:hypothetical protein
LQKDIDGGNTVLGGIITAVNREQGLSDFCIVMHIRVVLIFYTSGKREHGISKAMLFSVM